MLGVLERVDQDLERGELWRARNRLEGYVGSQGYQREVLERLGEVCHDMGDLPAAGRFWFFTPLDTGEKQDAVGTFVRQAGEPQDVYHRLPRRLRAGRWNRFPAEVQDRLRTLVGDPNATRAPAPRPRPIETPLTQGLSPADGLVMAVGVFVAVFFIACFGLGVRVLFDALL